jgi:probable phosphoglycerate mutase
MRLLLIRHGETAANAEGRLQGHIDFPLSERGRRESELLAERLAGLSVQALYASPLARAREAAEIVSARLGLPIEVRGALMERSVGELAGLTREEIRARYPEYVKARAEARPDVGVPGYEVDGEFQRRVLECLGTIVEAHPGETVAAITHGGVIGAYVRETLRLPIVRPNPFAVSNGSITTIDVSDGAFEERIRPRALLVSLNDVCHLDGP